MATKEEIKKPRDITSSRSQQELFDSLREVFQRNRFPTGVHYPLFVRAINNLERRKNPPSQDELEELKDYLFDVGQEEGLYGSESMGNCPPRVFYRLKLQELRIHQLEGNPDLVQRQAKELKEALDQSNFPDKAISNQLRRFAAKNGIELNS